MICLLYTSHTGLTEMANGINQMRLDTEHEYFNSGVMLIDLTAARKLVTAEDVFACVSEHEKELILPDQDVFNILYGKETRPVEDVLWNYDVRNYSKYLIRSAGKHDLSWVMRNTAVLHFCGRNKPWHEDYKNPFGMLYLHYICLLYTSRRSDILSADDGGSAPAVPCDLVSNAVIAAPRAASL